MALFGTTEDVSPVEPPTSQRSAKPRRLNIASGVVRLLENIRSMRSPDGGKRTAESIAMSLERDGDVAGAAEVREAIANPASMLAVRLSGPTSNVHWIPPTDMDSEIVLDGEYGAVVKRLAAALSSVGKFVALKIDAPTKILFHGPSGTGKTLTAKWLGWKLGLPVALVVLDRVVDCHIGETAKRLNSVIEEAGSTPSILFLDEIDGMCADRANGKTDVAELSRVTSSLLQQIDCARPDQIIIGATNYMDGLDSALRRRLSTQVLFALPCLEARVQMLRGWWKAVGYNEDALGELSARNVSGADLRALAMAAARRAVMSGFPVRLEDVQAGG